ncbi:hypothetical protein CDO52_07320 [Nocardiopsis gilva YIM 90087]|uniref:Cupin type-2 domain-containing protein n=1 Tax=Nocardiopsis gilva YIM 90087 TaxID=1235441 RepID=A0A223S3M2_9ACTN|nr:enoyl-CoA hydratase-related protein [Nocardiopsis gilva]ASU82619.1 hypothetical protein CDO52_07320 [Nocardiopsis gilva YIM 90087]
MMAPYASPSSCPLRWHIDFTGVVTLVLDQHGTTANLLTDGLVDALADAAEHLHRDRQDITGVLLTSAKPTFMLGTASDTLDHLAHDPHDRSATLGVLRTTLRRLERLGFPVVAAIGGSALGAGFELALACHHRILLEDDGCRVGLPDADAGLLPLAGGVSRSVHRWGSAPALANLLNDDAVYAPRRARALGLVDELAPDTDAMLRQAEAWIAAHPAPVQPWDRIGHRMPPGPAHTRPVASADVSSARATLISTAYRVAAMAGIDAALAIEQKEFGALLAETTTFRIRNRPAAPDRRGDDAADASDAAPEILRGHRSRGTCPTCRQARMDPLPIPAPARLLIAGRSGDGRSFDISEASPSRVAGEPGAVDDFWCTGPQEPGVPAAADAVGPPQGGSIFRMFYVQPDRVWQGGDGDQGEEDVRTRDVLRILGHNAIGGGTADADALGGAGSTTGYFIVLSGTVVCVLGDDEVELGPGDVVVQDRTGHAWSNRTDELAVIGVVLVSGQ